MKSSLSQLLFTKAKLGRELLLDTVWPEQSLCLCCKKVLRPFDLALQPDQPDTVLCLDCREALERRLFGKDGQITRTLFTDVLSAFRYSGPVRDLVLGLKHGTVSAAAGPLILYTADLAQRKLRLPPDTVVTWVTMPAGRRRERCIDHGRVLAEGIAMELGLPCRQLLLRRNGGHTQQGLNAEERSKNVTGLFSVISGELPGSVLLVDDVLTTGSTLGECAKVLRTAGIRDISALTVCAAG